MFRPRLINSFLLLMLVVGTVVAAPHLPARYPIHFQLDGTADRYAARNSGEWYFVALFAFVMAVMLWAVGRWSLSHPSLINIPNKQKLLQLPPDRQREALEGVREMMDWLALLLTIVFILIQAALYEFAMGRNGKSWLLGAMFLAIVGTPLVTFRLAAGVSGRIEELARTSGVGGRSGSLAGPPRG